LSTASATAQAVLGFFTTELRDKVILSFNTRGPRETEYQLRYRVGMPGHRMPRRPGISADGEILLTRDCL